MPSKNSEQVRRIEEDQPNLQETILDLVQTSSAKGQ